MCVRGGGGHSVQGRIVFNGGSYSRAHLDRAHRVQRAFNSVVSFKHIETLEKESTQLHLVGLFVCVYLG